jgi:SAM-dependent methyltransferase
VSGWDGDEYQRRFDRLAASGVDVHGEAAFVAAMAPSSVLDAGCGTGRVAIELDRRGIEVVGVDGDGSMIATARRLAPHVEWHHHDLTTLDLGRQFDVVLMAGNVPLFTPPGTQPALVAGCARHGDVVVAGFSLDRGYGAGDYDRDCADAGLLLAERYATWDGEPFTGGGYAVSVHRSAASVLRSTHEWFEVNSGWAPPDVATLDDWSADGVSRAPDECLTTTTGACPHGLGSWHVVLASLET